MIKKLAIFASILTLFLVLAIPNSTKAATGNVSVTLPAFEVELNGIKHNSETMKYPFLTYKDITYVPMTWTMSLVTGLQLQWSGEEGLSVYKSGNPFAVKPELETGGNFKKGRAYNAQVVPFAVTVNGQSVNNASQPYPLLVFQDITYFPLTWTYAVENFGWNLNWDAIQGFKVGSDQRSYMGSLIHEDEQHYYVEAYNTEGRAFKINKNLVGTPELLSSEQSKPLLDGFWRPTTVAGSKSSLDGTKTTEYKDGQIWLNGISLLNVQKWEEPNRSFREAHKRNETFTYAEDVFEIGPDTIVVQFLLPTSSTLNPITGVQGDHPAVLIQGGKVTLLQGLNRPFYDSQNSEKGKWLWTFSATRVSARSFNDVGQIYWVDKDGTTRNLNTILNATYLRVLYAREDRLLVQAYDLFRQNSEGKQSGYLWLHSNGTYEKVTELTPSRDPINSPTASGDNLLSAFVDSKLGVLVVQNNTITNMSTGQSRVWWDYELRALVKDDPIGGYPGQ